MQRLKWFQVSCQLRKSSDASKIICYKSIGAYLKSFSWILMEIYTTYKNQISRRTKVSLVIVQWTHWIKKIFEIQSYSMEKFNWVRTIPSKCEKSSSHRNTSELQDSLYSKQNKGFYWSYKKRKVGDLKGKVKIAALEIISI